MSSKSNPAYNQLSSAIKDLAHATVLSKRRNAIEKLTSLLQNQTIRSKIALESYRASKASNDASPYRPLKKAYSNAIQTALQAARTMLDSKSKAKKKKEDWMCPFKVLFAVDSDSEPYASLSSGSNSKQKKKCNDRYYHDADEPFTYESFDRLRDTNSQSRMTLASSKDIKDILAFCLEDCMTHDDCMTIADRAGGVTGEVELMKVLQKLCARSDYVTHFHPRHDVIEILKVVSPKLEVMDECSLPAAKALYQLVHNLTVNLGVQIHTFVWQCLALVVDYIRAMREDAVNNNGGSSSTAGTQSPQIMTYMYGVAVDIMVHYPEQCVAVLSQDDFGKDMFGHARKCWNTARRELKEALVDYFSAHLLVSEVAGNIQGLLPGDLGVIGNASIDEERLGFLKEMFLSEQSLELFSAMQINAEETKSAPSSSAATRTRNRPKSHLHFRPLARRQRVYLEMCARLLRCCQRVYLANSELNSSELKDNLFDNCFEKGLITKGLGCGDEGVEYLSSSPWVEIIAHCFGHAIESELEGHSSTAILDDDDNSIPAGGDLDYSFFSQADSTANQTHEKSDVRDIFSSLPLIKSILERNESITNSTSALDDSKIELYLQIISACAEVYPRGECWSSSNKWHRTNYTPFEVGDVVTYCNACNPTDLASLIYCLSIILDRYGNADGNIMIQNWTIVCLLKLTEATHIVCKYHDVTDDEFNLKQLNEVAVAWQCVWNKLLNSDRRYHAYTANASPSSTGELVLMLLTELVRGGLTEAEILVASDTDNIGNVQKSSFLRKHQEEVWNLPAFSSGSELETSAAFELATAIIHQCGLVEGEEDIIASKGLELEMQQRVRQESAQGRGRRFRLVSFFLQFYTSILHTTNIDLMRRIIPSGTAMICAILDGQILVVSEYSFALQALRQLKMTENIECISAANQAEYKDERITSIEIIWEDSIRPFWFQDSVDPLLLKKFRGKNATHTCSYWSYSDRVWLKKRYKSFFLRSAAHTSAQMLSDIKDYVLGTMLNSLEPHDLDEDVDSDNGSTSALSLASKAIGMKCIISGALCGDAVQRKLSPWRPIEDTLHSLLSGILSNTKNLLSTDDEFCGILTDVLGIIRVTRQFISTEFDPRYIENLLPPKLSLDLFKRCKELMKMFVARRDVPVVIVQRDSQSKSSRPSSFDFDEDDSVRPRSKPRPSFSSESDEEDLEDEGAKPRKRKRAFDKDNRKDDRLTKRSRGNDVGKQVDKSIDSKIAFLCASIMLVIDPSYESCSFVSEAIIWPGESFFVPVEPHNCLVCLGLIFSFGSFKNSSTEDKNAHGVTTIIPLCLDIISKGREISKGSSPFHMIGFHACSILLSKRFCEMEKALDDEEIKPLIKTIVPDGVSTVRSLNMCPSHRLSQITTAKSCFLIDDDGFLKDFGDHFRSLIMNSLKDKIAEVRKAGIQALGTALLRFSFQAQKQIAKAALAKYPSDPNTNGSKKKGEKFSVWVRRQVENVNPDFVDFESGAWHENKHVLVGDKIRCIGMIGSMTKDIGVTENMVRLLIDISMTRNLRAVAFKQLETLAAHQKYDCAEYLISDCEVNLLQNWFEHGRKMTTLPITLTYPSLVRSIMRLRCDDNKIPDVISGAFDEYLAQNVELILPCVFIAHADLPKDDIEDIIMSVKNLSEETEGKTYLEILLVELASTCGGNVEVLLKAHFHDIYAHFLPMFVFEEESGTVPLHQDASTIVGALSMLIKNVRDRIKKYSDLIISQLLNAGVRKLISYNEVNIECKVYIQALDHLANTISGKEVETQEVFDRARTSATELLLATKQLLVKSTNDTSRRMAWELLDAIAEVIQDSPNSNEVGFCFESLLGILLGTRDDSLRKGILTRLKNMLVYLTKFERSESISSNLLPLLNKIVSSLIRIHEEYQTIFVETCLSKWSSNRSRTRIGSSFLDGAICAYDDFSQDVSHGAKAISAFGDTVKSDIVDCLNLTFGILEIILDTQRDYFESTHHFVDPFPESKLHKSTLDALSLFKCECSLSHLFKTFDDLRDQDIAANFKQNIERFIFTSSRFRATIVASRGMPSQEKIQYMTTEERSQLAALRHLGQDIQNGKISGNNSEGFNSILKDLLNELFTLCEKHYNGEIQLASMKCIGHLMSDQIWPINGHTYNILSDGNIERGHREENPLPGIFSAAFVLISNCVRSDDIDIAMTAKDTAKNLFATKDGAAIWKLSNERGNFCSVLHPIKAFKRGNQSELPERFRLQLLALSGKSEDDLGRDKSWCWNDTLWTFPSGGQANYEKWIKFLVCSIIICCYGGKDGDAKTPQSVCIRGKSDFFVSCLGLCARDHKFAATLFPGILYDILDNDSIDDYNDVNKPKRGYLIGAPFSLANQTLTRCFQKILRPLDTVGSQSMDRVSLSSIDNSAINIIVTTLDDLRVAAESAFMSLSPGKGVSYKARGRSDSSPSWRGRPFGITLQLTGSEISSAYAHTKDFASALYYAELFADNRLGGSGCTFEDICKGDWMQTSLSGFGIPIEANINYGGDQRLGVDSSNRAIALYHILQRCYAGLHEEDNIAGLEEQLSSIKFEHPEHFRPTMPRFSNMSSTSEMLKALVDLDTRSQLCHSNGINNTLALSVGLSHIGMRHSSLQLLASAGSLLGMVSEEDKTKLSNQWAEETWRLYQWDNSLLSPETLQAGSFQESQQRQNCGPKLNFESLFQEKMGFQIALKNSMSSLIEDDFPSFNRHLFQARNSFLENLNTSVGSSTPLIELNGHSIRACILNEMEDLSNVLSGSKPASEWMAKWCSDRNILTNALNVNAQFDDIELAMATREIFVKMIYRKHGENRNDDIGQNVRKHMWRICSLSRYHKRAFVARSALERLRQFDKANSLVFENRDLQVIESTQFSLEEARIAHCSGSTTAAIRSCKEIIKSLDRVGIGDVSEELQGLRVEVQLQCAEWSILYPTETSTAILKHFLEPAAQLAKTLHNKRTDGLPQKWSSLLSTANFALADFVFKLYDTIEKRLESKEWKMLQKAASGRKDEYNQLLDQNNSFKKSPKKGSKEYDFLLNVQKEARRLSVEVDNDTREINGVLMSLKKYRKLAIESYGTALQTFAGESNHSRDVYRLISMWFRNCDSMDDINIDDTLHKIPSYHFVPLIYQIFSRISGNDKHAFEPNQFQTILQKLIRRVCEEHPYHGIVQMIALSNGNTVDNLTYSENVGASKSEESKKLLLRVKKRSNFLSELVDSYILLTDSIIDLALAPTRQLVERRTLKKIPFSKVQNSSKSLVNIMRRCNYKPCILTKLPHIQPGRDYGNGKDNPPGSELIDKFVAHFAITDSGVHRPKIVVCVSSKGNEFTQLVKGNDDIRQDAVLQQVFSTVNMLLSSRKRINDRHLKLVTYSCVPLSPIAGILQWVDNTAPMRDFLVKAHPRYYPNDWSLSCCSLHYKDGPKETKRQTYDEVCRHLSPAFRFFFLEQFGHSRQLWHEARMAYIRSCAVNSMVGHILGIGDRHTSNILLSQRTGEIVHIDFGIVFEQGKTLPVKETVPFRLTRDTVDGMGPTGVEGSFIAAAKETMDVLRNNSSTLLTVLSAVISDPMYNWCLNPVKARQRQQEDNTSMEDGGQEHSDTRGADILSSISNLDQSPSNDAATRTIAKINQKLSGYEEGTSDKNSVEGQVRLLINAARDADNLCQLYVGWAPFY